MCEYDSAAGEGREGSRRGRLATNSAAPSCRRAGAILGRGRDRETPRTGRDPPGMNVRGLVSRVLCLMNAMLNRNSASEAQGIVGIAAQQRLVAGVRFVQAANDCSISPVQTGFGRAWSGRPRARIPDRVLAVARCSRRFMSTLRSSAVSAGHDARHPKHIREVRRMLERKHAPWRCGPRPRRAGPTWISSRLARARRRLPSRRVPGALRGVAVLRVRA